MPTQIHGIRAVGLAVAALLSASLAIGQVFGVQDYNHTTVAALAFTGASFHVSGSLGRFGDLNVDQHFYAAVQIPAGSIMDYIVLNNLNDGTPGALVATLWLRDAVGNPFSIRSLASTPHASWADDMNSEPYGFVIGGIGSSAMFLDVEIPASPNLQFFGEVEVLWRRSVSITPPGSASFNDVPTDHPFFQYIEALKASGITGGCQAVPPLYCPDNPVTRGQMAVFLAKALGLHWPL
jgi:hypothetical protein